MTEQIEGLTNFEIKEMFAYLNTLRDSGELNMFGARPYLVNEFDIERSVAQEVLMAWMKSK